ncbi:MAG: Gfo/Idh/MocA family oxidoreductase [bacterium]|nr:Gfo/Idh/MocA family oxidoreductase [bacterium]
MAKPGLSARRAPKRTLGVPSQPTPPGATPLTRSPSPTRRQFLASAAALTAPAVWTTPVRAQDGAAPADAIHIGVIGTGIRGRNLLPRFLDNAGYRVVAVCDVDATRRADAKRRVDEKYASRDCVPYLDYRELLTRADIDAVVIATPDHWHALQIVDACRAGKDVYCEKPLTLTLRESQVVIEAARAHDCIFQTGSQQRTEFGHKFVKAVEYVRAGRIGRVLNVNVGVGSAPRWCDLEPEELEPQLDWNRWLGPAPERPYNSVLSPRGVHGHYPQWRRYREYSGGHLADMGAHHFDIVQWALGADNKGPVRVVPPSDPSAERGAALVYADGTRLTHGGPSGATFIGTAGMIHVDRGRILSVPGKILEEELGESDESLPRMQNHQSDWLEAMRNRARPTCDVEVGARSVAICQLMNIAYWHGRELTWNPTTWRFVEDHANAWLDYERRAGFELNV